MQFGGAMFFTDYSMSSMELARALEERGFRNRQAIIDGNLAELRRATSQKPLDFQ